MRLRRLALFMIFPLILISALIAVGGFSQPASAQGRRVVVLGFDGMDFDLASRYIDEGLLPNLAQLRDQGIYSPLWSSIPPESPVAWSTFVTGTNPGKTGIFDFLRSNPGNYFPELTMTDVV